MTKNNKNGAHTTGKSFDTRLDQLDNELDRLERKARTKDARVNRGTAMGKAFRLVTELIVGLVVGGFLGWWIDKWAGTGPIFLLIFFALGAGAGILNVMRAAKSMQADMLQAQNAQEDEGRQD